MKKTIIATILLLIVLCFGACRYDIYYPTYGKWFCEELQTQIAFRDKEQTFAIVNGEKVYCVAMVMGSSKRVVISCQDHKSQQMKAGEDILVGDILGYDEECLRIQDAYSETVYYFYRVLED